MSSPAPTNVPELHVSSFRFLPSPRDFFRLLSPTPFAHRQRVSRNHPYVSFGSNARGKLQTAILRSIFLFR